MMQVKSAGLTFLEDEYRRLTVETAHGLIGLRPGKTAETAGFIGAVDEHWIFVMKNAVVAQMQHVMPGVAAQMCWSNWPEAGSLPPSFSFVEVREVSELGSDWGLQLQHLERLANGRFGARAPIEPRLTKIRKVRIAANGRPHPDAAS
ncbi:MAG: hypothetical protein AAGI03_13510 [Pseudomonadota bacterium]